MKVTSYEISKKLAKIGFKAGTEFYWSLNENGKPFNFRITTHILQFSEYGWETFDRYGAYDLETILEALPEWIHDKETCSSEESLELTKNCIQYSSTLSFNYHRVDRQENESLADTAARLLILLESKGLIKFKE